MPPLRKRNGRFMTNLGIAVRNAEARRLRAAGLTFQQIADRLDVSITTAWFAVKRKKRPTGWDSVRKNPERLAREIARTAAWHEAREIASRDRDMHVRIAEGTVTYWGNGGNLEAPPPAPPTVDARVEPPAPGRHRRPRARFETLWPR